MGPFSIMAKPKLNPIKQAGKRSIQAALPISFDPVSWVEDNLGWKLYSNQIRDIEDLFNEDIPEFNVLAVRGAGKSQGLCLGLAAYSIKYPGLRTIVVGPKEKQAGRLVKEITAILRSKKCKVKNEVDWANSSQHRIQFHNGSYIIALSGQAEANVEGEHGHILVIDEAHKVPSFSVSEKFGPMIGMLAFSKTVKIGVAIGKNHFHKSCTVPDAVVNKTTWRDAEIYLDKPKKDLILFNKQYYSKYLLRKMPVPYKEKYFPGRPDLWKETGAEVTTLSWEMQYELMWKDDILNFLSDDDQKRLFVGTHDLLIRGLPNEIYCAGLDTAQGSLSGRTGTDETVLSIWRLRKDGTKEKVATYIWVGKPLEQEEEIWQIINPTDGLFKCRMTLVDYSNIGINITDRFRARKMPILGKLFGATEPKSKKNWKNAMYDYFQVQLQTNKIKYGDTKLLEKKRISATGGMLTQIVNTLRGAWEWGTLQRIRKGGNNDIIEAPSEGVEGEDGETEKAHDDVCSSDILGVWALDHIDALLEEVADAGNLSAYQIPTAVIGMSNLQAPGAVFGESSGHGRPMNPIAQAQAKRDNPVSNVGTADGNSWMSNILTQIATGKK